MKTKLIVAMMMVMVTIGSQSFSQVKEKEEEYVQIDEGNPLFINGNVVGKDVGANVIFSSIITPYSPGIIPSYFYAAGRDNIKNGKSVGWIGNLPVKKIFQVLYGTDTNHQGDLYFNFFNVPNSRVVFKDVDSSKLISYRNGVIQNQNLYTIQFTAKIDMPIAQMSKKMINDMELCFGLKTGWVKQVKKCIVISRSKSPLTEYKEGPIVAKWGNNLVDLNGIPMDKLISIMAIDKPFFNCSYPIVDETNFKGKLGKISFPVSDQKIDYAFLSKELPKYGLAFSLEDREVDMLVISGTEK